MKPSITLVLRIGEFGEKQYAIVLPLSETLTKELMEPVELSDNPLSILLASPGFYGGYGDAVTIRKKKFRLREATAKEIAREIEKTLLEMFGENDKTDGYSKEQLKRQIL
jgi:hypothetical protein